MSEATIQSWLERASRSSPPASPERADRNRIAGVSWLSPYRGNQKRANGVKLFMTLRVRDLAKCAAALFAAIACAQIQPAAPGVPSFDAQRVLLVDHAVPLAPGLILSIFGSNLGPTSGCQGNADIEHRATLSALRPDQTFVETLIYPKELCGTRVLVAGIPAGLLYVQSGQINFQVPQETSIQGTADLVVVYQGRSSKAVAMPLGIEPATLSLESPARVDMPVWLKFRLPYQRESPIRYPFMIFPASFGCNEIEVRRNGVLLPRIADIGSQAIGGIAISGSPCGSIAFSSEAHFKGRFPLHLQYRFDQPGTYEVRLTRRRPFSNDPPSVTTWTTIEILPADPRARRLWLDETSAHAPTSTADLLADFLPGILGLPDDHSLAILRPYLYHPDRLVREYAMYGLTYWPAQQAVQKVWEWVRVQGPSSATVDYLLHAPEFAKAYGAQLAEISISYLESNSPVLVNGALRALSQIVLPSDSQASNELHARTADAMIHAAGNIIQVDPQNINEYVSRLGQVQDERAHALLWDLVSRHVGYEQALIALTWRKSLPDLPKLAELPLQPAQGKPLDYQFAGLPYALHNAYGDAAIPYLDRMLQQSEFTWVRANSARELIVAGRPEGFAFVADAIANDRSYRGELIQFVRDRFPELRQAGDPAILKFVQTRATGY